MAKQPNQKRMDASRVDRQNMKGETVQRADGKLITPQENSIIEEQIFDKELSRESVRGKVKSMGERPLRSELEGMSMRSLRIVGDKLGVRSPKKAELIDRILIAWA